MKITKQSKIDVAFILVYLTSFAAIFFPFRPYPVSNIFLALIFLIISISSFFLWNFISCNEMVQKVIGLKLANRNYWIFVSLLLVGTNFLIYAPISLLHFDTGTDLTIAFGIDKIWWPRWAEYMNRPLVGIGPYFAMLVSDNSLDGFLLVNVLSRLVTCISIVIFCNLIYPKNLMFGILSGLFFSVNHGEISQFNLWSIYYNVSVASLFVAITLFVYSFKNKQRAVLGFSCLCLSFALLQYEHGYFIAAAVPLLLIWLYGFTVSLASWALAWWGILGILSLRLLNFMKTSSNYQTDLFATSKSPANLEEWISLIFENASTQIKPIFNFGIFLTHISSYLLTSFFIFIVVVGFICYLQSRVLPKTTSGIKENPADLLTILFIGLSISILGILVFIGLPVAIHDPDYTAHPTMRYQYFSAVGYAIFWAAIVCILASLFQSRKSKVVVFACASGLLCAGTISESLDYQKRGGVLNSYFDYQKASDIYIEIKKSLPLLDKDDLIFLDISDEIDSPLGWNYTALHYSCRVFGSPMQIGVSNEKNEIKLRLWGHSNSVKASGPKCKTIHYFKYSKEDGVKFIATEHQAVSSDLPGCGTMCLVNSLALPPDSALPFLRFKFIDPYQLLY
jgi:hypothetical protein